MDRDGDEKGRGGSDASHAMFPLDRSKVRILLCEKDPKSSEEVLGLLQKCSYQVTPVKTARQVIEVLNAQGPDIDIILAEIDLPVAKGFKMLKYITRDKELRRIPIIMMPAQDEVSVIVKCLRLGAADYLVKPLRTNELLNLWTHMWRRRRMLGLAEKDVFVHDFEMILSDPSNANTNSTNLLSDDVDSMTTHQETNVSNYHEYECNTSAMEARSFSSLGNESHIQENIQRPGVFSCPKKTDLKIGEYSAFLTYVRSSAPTGNLQAGHIHANAAPSEALNGERNLLITGDAEVIYRRPQESNFNQNGLVTGENVCDRSYFPQPVEFPVLCLSSDTQSKARNEAPVDVSAIRSVYPLPIYVPGVMEQNMISSSVQMFHGSLNDAQAHTSQMPLYNVPPHCHHAHMMPSFSYHPAVHLQSGQGDSPHLWSSVASTSIPEATSGRAERRAAALAKFRLKRKYRCFDKKIRYVNRKQLAEKRQRIRGQFVRQVNGLDAVGETETDEDAAPFVRESELGSSSEHNASDL